MVNALGLKSHLLDGQRKDRQKSQALGKSIKTGWNGLADWLGKKKGQILPYEEAKKVVNALGLKSWDDWWRWSRTERPPDI